MAFGSNPFVCDGCGKDRRLDSNHWFVLWEWNADETTKGIAMLPFSMDEAVKPNRVHTCGLNCTLKLIERFLAFGSFESRPFPKGSALTQ